MGPRGEFSKKAQVTEEQKIILRFALMACVPTPGFSPEGEMVVVLVGSTWREPPLTLVQKSERLISDNGEIIKADYPSKQVCMEDDDVNKDNDE
jgi:hypothetical protein